MSLRPRHLRRRLRRLEDGARAVSGFDLVRLLFDVAPRRGSLWPWLRRAGYTQSWTHDVVVRGPRTRLEPVWRAR